jgi:hypothetical protein
MVPLTNKEITLQSMERLVKFLPES